MGGACDGSHAAYVHGHWHKMHMLDTHRHGGHTGMNIWLHECMAFLWGWVDLSHSFISMMQQTELAWVQAR